MINVGVKEPLDGLGRSDCACASLGQTTEFFTSQLAALTRGNREIFQAFKGFISYARGVAILLGDA